MGEQMEFPKTWEEYEKEYGFYDFKEVYTNDSRLIQSFRVKQWLDHLPSIRPKTRTGYWIKHNIGHSIYYDCSLCGCAAPCTETADKILWKLSNYCPDCGAEMTESEE